MISIELLGKWGALALFYMGIILAVYIVERMFAIPRDYKKFIKGLGLLWVLYVVLSYIMSYYE